MCRPDSFNNHYICGKSPCDTEEPETVNLDVDHEFFEKEIWSRLAHRVPAFEEAKVTYNSIQNKYFRITNNKTNKNVV